MTTRSSLCSTSVLLASASARHSLVDLRICPCARNWASGMTIIGADGSKSTVPAGSSRLSELCRRPVFGFIVPRSPGSPSVGALCGCGCGTFAIIDACDSSIHAFTRSGTCVVLSTETQRSPMSFGGPALSPSSLRPF